MFVKDVILNVCCWTKLEMNLNSHERICDVQKAIKAPHALWRL